MNWLTLQLADSAFPVGGFAHSGGLEAALQSGEVSDIATLRQFVLDSLSMSGHGGLPLVSATHREPARWSELDGLCDAFLSNPVANRASRAQGRAMLSTCDRSFPLPEMQSVRERARREKLLLHHAPTFGAILRTLGVDLDETQRLFLYLGVRGVISAAVRLNIVGPHQAQTLQVECSPYLDATLDECAGLEAEDLAQTAPIVDLVQSLHDRQYSRLFLS